MSALSDLLDHGTKLWGDRQSLHSLWQELADHFYVERADFTRTRYLGEEFAAHLTSSYPLMVRRELGNSFSVMLRSADWFSMTTDREDKLDRSAKAWLEWATENQRKAMADARSMFVRATKEADHDYATFGQAVISLDFDRARNGLLYRCWHLRDVVWCERYDGSIGPVHRKWRPTLRMLSQLFPGKLHANCQAHLSKEPFREIECRHIVLPAEDYDPIDGVTVRTPWVSITVDVENKHVLEIVGSWRRIYTIPRWQTVSGSPYAFSPATVVALPDARLLQSMALTLLEAGELAVRPPLVAQSEVIRGDINYYAGGITWAHAEYDERLGAALRPLMQDKGGLPIGRDMHADTREMLFQAFYLNKIALPPMNREMTAYEAGERVKEYVRTATPLFEPMELEYNAALCEDTFEALLRHGGFGRKEDIPQSLKGADVSFRFKSPLREAEERKQGSTFLETKQIIREAVEIDPASIAILDTRIALRKALEGIGTPMAWLRDERAVTEYATKMAEREEAAAAAQELQQGAITAQEVGAAEEQLRNAERFA